MTDPTIVTRFAPSPTGHLHVGGARTALFNYLCAKCNQGTFLLRIEDTDRARHVEGADAQIIEDLRWLGILPENIEQVPRQSDNRDRYRSAADRLLSSGQAYYAIETPEELAQLREQANTEKRSFIYPRPNPLPTPEDADLARGGGRPVVIRFKNPQHDVVVDDAVYGEVTVAADQQDDFVIVKADGWPTYHLANVCDDNAMEITLVARGQEFLAQTWRHIVLQEALGYRQPRYAHLPLIMDMRGRKLSKRDGDVEVGVFRKAGYLPEVLVNFLALLGWSDGSDQEKFTLSELEQRFDIGRLNKTNAKFDREKLLAFNTDACRELGQDRLSDGLRDYLQHKDTAIPSADNAILVALIQANKGFRTFTDIVRKSEVLFVDDNLFEYDQKAVEKVLKKGDGAGFAILSKIRVGLGSCDWSEGALEGWMGQFLEREKLGMNKVAQPIRVAVTGNTVSPMIVATLMILGRERTLRRIDRCLKLHEA